MQAIIDAIKNFDFSSINFSEIIAKIQEIVNSLLGMLPLGK